MKVYKLIRIDIDTNQTIEEVSYEYDGPVALLCGDSDSGGDAGGSDSDSGGRAGSDSDNAGENDSGGLGGGGASSGRGGSGGNDSESGGGLGGGDTSGRGGGSSGRGGNEGGGIGADTSTREGDAGLGTGTRGESSVGRGSTDAARGSIGEGADSDVGSGVDSTDSVGLGSSRRGAAEQEAGSTAGVGTAETGTAGVSFGSTTTEGFGDLTSDIIEAPFSLRMPSFLSSLLNMEEGTIPGMIAGTSVGAMSRATLGPLGATIGSTFGPAGTVAGGLLGMAAGTALGRHVGADVANSINSRAELESATAHNAARTGQDFSGLEGSRSSTGPGDLNDENSGGFRGREENAMGTRAPTPANETPATETETPADEVPETDLPIDDLIDNAWQRFYAFQNAGPSTYNTRYYQPGPYAIRRESLGDMNTPPDSFSLF